MSSVITGSEQSAPLRIRVSVAVAAFTLQLALVVGGGLLKYGRLEAQVITNGEARVTRLEAVVPAVDKRLERLEDKLDRVLERRK